MVIYPHPFVSNLYLNLSCRGPPKMVKYGFKSIGTVHNVSLAAFRTIFSNKGGPLNDRLIYALDTGKIWTGYI